MNFNRNFLSFQACFYGFICAFAVISDYSFFPITTPQVSFIGDYRLCTFPLSRKELSYRGFFMFLFTFTMLSSSGLIPAYFWVTDITYIPTGKGMAYLCAVIDLCGKMVLAYRIGNDMTSSLVTDTVREAWQNAGQKEKAADGLALHCDQGSQYTSQAYFNLTQVYHIRPSMSSPGCPYDNAAMKTFSEC